MPTPKKKTSRMKKGQRRSHDHLKAPTLTDCPNCHDKTLPHTVCPHCGFYKGRQVVQPKES